MYVWEEFEGVEKAQKRSNPNQYKTRIMSHSERRSSTFIYNNVALSQGAWGTEYSLRLLSPDLDDFLSRAAMLFPRRLTSDLRRDSVRTV